jgi:Papain family cysteine protease
MATKKKPSAASVSFNDRLCNLVPSKDTTKDWTFQDALAAGTFGAPAALPNTVDLRKPWWAINDQKDTGSCVGWASADGVLRHHLVQANRIQNNELLSPRFVWMASKETDEFSGKPETFIEEAGTSLKGAMDVLRKYGCVMNDLLPFDLVTRMYIGSENVFYANASTRKIANYFNLAKNTNQWKAWLASNGPILVGLNVDDTWGAATDTRGLLDTFKPATVRGGHAVCLVGYKDNRFIIRNSWGTGWGDQGFGYASMDYIDKAFFGESYGITL